MNNKKRKKHDPTADNVQDTPKNITGVDDHTENTIAQMVKEQQDLITDHHEEKREKRHP